MKTFIPHISTLKPIPFISWSRFMMNKHRGVIDSRYIKVTEKIDGSAFSFGLNSIDQFYGKSSTSSPMFNVGDFEKRDIQKGYSGEVGRHFDSILYHLKYNKAVHNMLKSFNDGGIEVVGEILYRDLAIGESKTSIKFIRIPYPKYRVGEIFSFFPIAVKDSEGNTHKNEKIIIRKLVRLSDHLYKFAHADYVFAISVHDILKEVLNYEEHINTILTSRRKIHKEEKEKMKKEIHDLQLRMEDRIRQHLPNDIEGIVIGDAVKVVTNTFKNSESPF